MRFDKLVIADVVLVTPKPHRDGRGYFVETFRADLFEAAIGGHSFVQDNQSRSGEAGTVRGLHFQLNPMAQGKLVRCLAGAIVDVAVDIRKGSPTYGQHVAAELSADNGCQLWVPPGFAHGYCTLVADSIIAYKVTAYYSPNHDRGLKWDDPALGIAWPVAADAAVLSPRDRLHPVLADLDADFVFA